MNLAKKGMQYFHENGFILTAKKTLNKCYRIVKNIPLRVAEKLIANSKIKELHELTKGKKAYIFIPCIDWQIPLYQRPHQMAWELSTRENSVVFFVSDQYKYDGFCFDKKIEENLYLYSIPVVKHLNEILCGCEEITVIMMWTRQASLLGKIKYDKLIYDYVDDLTLFYYCDEEMVRTHEELMRTADLTVVTADRLYESAKPYARNLLLSENAGDYHFFSQSKGCAVNPLIAPYLSKYERVLGYYGSLARWFDYEVILHVARMREDWLFILVGHLFDETARQALADKPDNILCIPAQPYKNLPSFLTAFDIALVPFVINDITLATSPVKIFEYMAGGKPVLSSNLPECKKYKSVFRYQDKDDFIIQAEEIFSLSKEKEYLALLNKEARENNWATRIDSILKKCEEVS